MGQDIPPRPPDHFAAEETRALTDAAPFRGQPLMLLGVLLAGWVGMRVAIWQAPNFGGDGLAVAATGDGERNPLASSGRSGGISVQPAAGMLPGSLQRPLPKRSAFTSRVGMLDLPSAVQAGFVTNLSADGDHRVAAELASPERNTAASAPLEHDLTTPQPRNVAPNPFASPPRMAQDRPLRWSADAWLLLREEKNVGVLIPQGSYGRSQVGAALRYRLLPDSGHAPQAHLRASAALSDPATGQNEREIALGLSARPIPSVPVRLAAEARVSEHNGSARVRPAIYAVTELAPVTLPLDARGELYVQAGYVSGDDATAFIDGQARVDRTIAEVGPAEFFAGAGAWGGAQDGASRLDVGPSVGVGLSAGAIRGRLIADYRLRIAGDSHPSSGPALTLFAGF